MQADWAVELGPDDEVLEFPWASTDGTLHYLDIKSDPSLIYEMEEALDCDPLREFLAALNAPHSALLTAKCDTWSSDELTHEEDVFQAAVKFGSYVDVLFAAAELRFCFEEHESLAKQAAELLERAPEISAAAELLVRRCYFRDQPSFGGNGHEPDPRGGYYITVYLFGYGDDDEDARNRWGVGMNLTQNALLQITARRGPQSG
jgi:hypothetical protein